MKNQGRSEPVLMAPPKPSTAKQPGRKNSGPLLPPTPTANDAVSGNKPCVCGLVMPLSPAAHIKFGDITYCGSFCPAFSRAKKAAMGKIATAAK